MLLETDIATQIETSNKRNPFVLYIEMQIGKDGKGNNFSKRFFNYNTSWRNDNFFKDCYFIGLYFVLDYEYKGSNNVNLIKTRNKEYKSKNINIIDIDINNEIYNIMKDEPVIINKEEIDDNGKEYIKLLGIRNWCKRDSSKYALPKLPLLSSNEIFLECLEILGSVGQNALFLMKVYEQCLFDEEKEKEKNDREHIILAFTLFITKSYPINF